MSSILASLSRHTLRQLKFILPGGLVTFYLGSHNEFLRVYHEEQGLAGTLVLLSLALSAVTLGLFLYILAFPLIRGEQPNYRHWRQSGVLSTVIPLLTTSILLGWSILAYVLGRWSNLGYIWGVIGASGLYSLSFGLLGLIPAPKVRRS
ncbi:hypothetical protein QCA50_005816 [Cerrena zonata]|uniref:Uncharacterized protein n=1 Tax=Cerrena zonata TaxID=2478898 RepID=A0AAW0GLB0_9APHY